MDYRLLRVFVSSRMKELKEERRQVKAALGEKSINAWVYEDDAGAAPGTIEQTYLDELEKADLYLGIFWRDFGQYTIEEYEYAERRGKDRLIYQKTVDIDGTRDLRLQAFLDRVGGHVKTGVTPGRFETVERLVELVALNVPALLAAIYRAQRAEGRLVPFQAPEPRADFVSRPALLDPLCRKLAAERDPPAFRVLALHGMPGGGKSELAAAAAHDTSVRNRYPDGVLWGVVGLEPDVTGLLAGWIQALGDREWRRTDAPSAQKHLHTMLQERAALIVLDDAWNVEHVNKLIAGGPRCAVLITTREAVVARAAHAAPEDIVEVGGMDSEQGLAVLAGGPQHALAAEERAQALEVAYAVGFLPFALTLAREQVAGGASWHELARDLRSETRRLESLDDAALDAITDEATRRQLSLVASVGVSLRRLSPERRRQLAWLGVLPEDTSVPAAAAATLWGLDEPSALRGLRSLRSSGLLLAGKPTIDGALTYLLHDVMHAMAKRLLVASSIAIGETQLPGLTLSPEAAQRAFLERHRSRCKGSGWHTLSDDGYIFDHLTWHLEHAQQADEIHALLREEDAAGGNGWFAAREQLGQSAGYASDLMHALRLAGRDLGRGLRYALMLASLRSIQNRVPPSLVAALLKAGIWSLPQALAYATNRHERDDKTDERTSTPLRDPGSANQPVNLAQRSRALALIADQVEEPQKTALLLEAYTAALQLDEDEHAVFPFIAGKLAAAELTAHAVRLARRAESGDPYVFALAAVCEHLHGEARAPIVAAAIAAVNGTQELFRAAAVAYLLPYLDAGQIRHVISEAARMDSEFFKGQVLATLVGGLAAVGEVEDARRHADAIAEPASRAAGLAELARYVPEAQRIELTSRALDLAAAISSETWSNQLDTALSYLPKAARAIVQFAHEHTSWRTDLLNNLSDGLPAAVQGRALDLALSDEDSLSVAQNFAALAPHLDAGLHQSGLEHVVQTLADVNDASLTARGLAAVLPFAGSARAELLERAWHALDEITLDLFREDALTELVPALADEELDRALDLVATVDDVDLRSQIIESMASRLSARLLPRALHVTRVVADPVERLFTQARLAGYLDVSTASDVFRRAGELPDKYPRAALLQEFPRPIAESLVEEALQTDLQRRDTSNLALWLVRRYAPLVSASRRTELFEQAVEAVSSTGDLSTMCDVMSAAVEVLERAPVEHILERLTDVAGHLSELPAGYAAVRLQIAAWPSLDRQRHRKVLRDAFSLLRQDCERPDHVLLRFLAGEFGPGRFGRLVAFIDSIEDVYERALACGALLPGAPASRRDELVRMALKNFDSIEADEYLTLDEKAQKMGASVLPYASDVSGALDAFATFEDADRRAQALIAVAANLGPGMFEKALDIARTLDPANRGRALLALERTGPRSSSRALLEEAWSAMLATESDVVGDDLLYELTERLCKLEQPALVDFLGERLFGLAAIPRPNLLAKLKHLAPALVQAGGNGVSQDLYRAIDDVVRWWP